MRQFVPAAAQEGGRKRCKVCSADGAAWSQNRELDGFGNRFWHSFCALDNRFCDGLVADFVHLIVLQVLVVHLVAGFVADFVVLQVW